MPEAEGAPYRNGYLVSVGRTPLSLRDISPRKETFE